MSGDMLTLSVVGVAELAASIRANLGFGSGAGVMLAELGLIAAATVLALAWLNPRLKRRAL